MAPIWVTEVRPGIAKWIYFVGFAITAIASWLLRDYSEQALKRIPELKKCYNPDGDAVTSCAGKGAVLRISFGNFLFFAVHVLLTLGVRHGKNPRRLVHTGFWPLKFCLWIFALGICFAMPNNTFLGYGQVARILSGVFLIFQIIILLDLIYTSNEWLLRKERLAFVLVIGSFIFYSGSVALIVACYHFYAQLATCGLNIFFITFTLVLTIVFTLVSVSPWRVENAGLLTSGAVFAYTAWILWSALTSEPDTYHCVFANDTVAGNAATIAFLIAIAAVCISTVNSGVESKSFEVESQLPEDDMLTYRPDFFHTVFALASAYLCMLYLNWNLNELPGQQPDQRFTGWISVWVKIASQWVCVLLYFWTLLAPRILRNRDFTFNLKAAGTVASANPVLTAK
eukprot:jgi/Astpho2/4622/e_gw1.00067.172.1_t